MEKNVMQEKIWREEILCWQRGGKDLQTTHRVICSPPGRLRTLAVLRTPKKDRTWCVGEKRANTPYIKGYLCVRIGRKKLSVSREGDRFVATLLAKTEDEDMLGWKEQPNLRVSR